MNLRLVIACLLTVWLFASNAYAQNFSGRVNIDDLPPASGAFAGVDETVTAIEFEGAKSQDRAELEDLISSKVGESYSAYSVRNDIKKLGKLARRVEARRMPHDGGVKIVYILKENPPIQSISIVGNSKIKTKRLLATIPLEEGDPLSADRLVETREKILKTYRAAGHSNTRVRIDAIENEDESINLQVFVDEGERLKIKDLKILGNDRISEFRIRQMIESSGSWLFFDSYYDESVFADDLQAIARLYVARGFFSASVQPGEFRYSESKKEVTPVIQIKEGPRYAVGDVTVSGATYFTPMETSQPFQRLIGKPYEANDMARAIRDLRKIYANEGFLLTDMSEDFDFNHDDATVEIDLRVEEGQRIRVGNVIIERASQDIDESDMSWFERTYMKLSPPVKDETIEREVRLEPGEVYRRDSEQETVKRLERLGIFDKVSAHSEPTDDPTVRNMVLDLEEGVTGNVVFGAGFGDASGAFVFASYTERNLFGEARDLRARVLLGTKNISANIGYFDRHFLDDGTSLGVDIYKSNWNRIGYSEDRFGTDVEFGKPIHEYLRAYLRARVAYVSIDEDDDIDLEENLDSYAVATVEVRGVNDTRDSEHWPTRGQVRALGVEGGWAGGPLVKLMGRYRYYHELRRELIYALNAEAGFMPIPADEVGISERLFMGGNEDLRGFRFRGAGPTDDDVPVGGSTKLLVQNELRFTLLDDLGVGRSQTPLRGLIFGDVGMLGRDPLELGAPRASVGFGVRADMARRISVGVDLALPVLKQSADRTQVLHFSVKSAF